MVSCVTRSIFSFSIILMLSCSNKAQQSNPIPPVKVLAPPVVRVEAPPVMVVPVPCPDDMVYIEKFHYCIDKYEAPNKEGAYPFYAQTAFQAVNYCRSVGKELCTQNQWHTACVGPQLKVYPYGNFYKRGTCNDAKYGWVKVPWLTMGTPAWQQWCTQQYKGDPSGSHPACVSDYGVYDMTGNVAEWTREPNSTYGYVTKGGYWYGVLRGTPTCAFVNPAHAPGFSSYEFGFRCCQIAK